MEDRSRRGFTRREFLGNASALGAASFLGLPHAAAAEPPPEATTIRLITDEAICLVPQFLSAELLRLEGFPEVEYVRQNYQEHASLASSVAASKADITGDAAINFAPLLDTRQSVVVLSGLHVGCWELFGGSRVRAIRDLKGKRIPITTTGAEEHLLTSSILAYLPYGHWRDFNPEDTLRFHALRLHEVGMIKSNPNQLIAQGTDWRFLNELKRELKA